MQLVELSGANRPDELGGESFAHQQTTPDAPHREFALAQYEDDIMAVNSKWKLVLNRKRENSLLFNRIDDPGETVNLFADQHFERPPEFTEFFAEIGIF